MLKPFATVLAGTRGRVGGGPGPAASSCDLTDLGPVTLAKRAGWRCSTGARTPCGSSSCTSLLPPCTVCDPGLKHCETWLLAIVQCWRHLRTVRARLAGLGGWRRRLVAQQMAGWEGAAAEMVALARAGAAASWGAVGGEGQARP